MESCESDVHGISRKRMESRNSDVRQDIGPLGSSKAFNIKSFTLNKIAPASVLSLQLNPIAVCFLLLQLGLVSLLVDLRFFDS